MATSLAELKASSPAYAAMSDLDFASKVYRKHYADKMSFPEFAAKTGFTNGDKPMDAASGEDPRVNAGAAMGKAFVDLGRGVRNAATDAARYAVESNPVIFGQSGADGLKARVAQQQGQQDVIAQQDAPLMATKAGKAGYVAGVAATTLLPGAGLRGTAVGRAMLPTTLRGMAAQGAVYGGVQPVGTQDSRALNTGVGGLAGLLGGAVPQGVGGLVGLVAKPFRAFTPAGENAAVASVLRGSATDASRLTTPQPSSIPGVNRTLAEESQDPGIAQLQRMIAAKHSGEFDVMRRQNNAARVGAIRDFAGEPADIAAARQARSAAATPLRDVATQKTGADTSGVLQLADSLHKKYTGASTVQNAIAQARDEIKAAGDNVGMLYNARKTIDGLISGKITARNSNDKAAVAELLPLKQALDAAMVKAAPEFGQYLSAFQKGSEPINRMQVGQSLMKSGTSPILDSTTGEYTLLPGSFGRQVKNMDAVAAKATKFSQAKASDILRPQDMATVNGVQDDLSRQAFADTAGRGSGSDTFQKFMTQGNAIGAMQAIGVSVPGAGILKLLGNKGTERINRALAAALANPEQARSILASVSPEERRVVQQMLSQAGGRLGVVAPPIAKQLMPQAASGQ